MTLQIARNNCSPLFRRVLGFTCVDSHSALIVNGGTVSVPVATLRATYGEKYDYPTPFPYEKKRFNVFHAMYDKTIPRFNENSKVIVVEGNIGVGKTEFAKRLAQQFDMKFFPPTTEKQCFLVKDYGYDVRGLDPLLPEGVQSYDLKKFYADAHPERGTVGRLQVKWYEERFYDYLTALKHLVNTGQGVVLARSVYSDIVFVEALRSLGWLSANFLKYYNMVRDNSICDLYHPHLTIYLDAPLKVLRERINKRNVPHEVKSRNFTDEYLKAIDRAYQHRFLPKMRESGEVVEIDWTEIANHADMEMIAEEMQTLKLEGEDNEDPKFADWARQDEDDWARFRILLEKPSMQQNYFILPLPWNCPEMVPNPDDIQALTQLCTTHPVFKHSPGWSPELGHKVWFKF